MNERLTVNLWIRSVNHSSNSRTPLNVRRKSDKPERRKTERKGDREKQRVRKRQRENNAMEYQIPVSTPLAECSSGVGYSQEIQTTGHAVQRRLNAEAALC